MSKKVMLWHQPGRPRCNCVTLLWMTRPDETGLQIVQTPPIFHPSSCSDMLTSSQVICNLSQQTTFWQPILRLLTKLHAWLQLNLLILLALPRLPFFNSLISFEGSRRHYTRGKIIGRVKTRYICKVSTIASSTLFPPCLSLPVKLEASL